MSKAASTLAPAKCRHLHAELATLLAELRYDGLLPGTGQTAPAEDPFHGDKKLYQSRVLDSLATLASDLDCRVERAAYDALRQAPDTEPAEHAPLALLEPVPAAVEPAEPEAEPEALATLAPLAPVEAALPADETPLPMTQPAVVVLPESLLAEDEEPTEAVISAETATPAPAPAEALDSFELAQTVTAQLMNRLDEELAAHYPPAVYDSFAELYFQFSTKLMERLADTDPHTLVQLMGREAAR